LTRNLVFFRYHSCKSTNGSYWAPRYSGTRVEAAWRSLLCLVVVHLCSSEACCFARLRFRSCS
jgi:hypothetical protein